MSEQIATSPMMPVQAGATSVLPSSAAPSMAPMCPLCHTLDRTVTPDSLRAGAEWRCTRCHQTWSAARLATAAAYERYQSAL